MALAMCSYESRHVYSGCQNIQLQEQLPTAYHQSLTCTKLSHALLLKDMVDVHLNLILDISVRPTCKNYLWFLHTYDHYQDGTLARQHLSIIANYLQFVKHCIFTFSSIQNLITQTTTNS